MKNQDAKEKYGLDVDVISIFHRYEWLGCSSAIFNIQDPGWRLKRYEMFL